MPVNLQEIQSLWSSKSAFQDTQRKRSSSKIQVFQVRISQKDTTQSSNDVWDSN